MRRTLVGIILVLTVVASMAVAQPALVPAALPASIDQWTAIVGVLLPLLIAVVNRTAWGSPLRAAAALGLCLLAAAGEVWVKGQWSVGAWGQNALAIFFLVVTTYHGFWKPTGLAEAVERRTG